MTDGADPAAIGPLMAQLRDPSHDPRGAFAPGRGEFAPRYQAVNALVKLGAPAVEPLCRALEEPDAYTRRFAAEALARIGEARATAPLLHALRTSERYAQPYLIGALAAVGDATALAPLCLTLANPELAPAALRAVHAVLTRTAAHSLAADLRAAADLPDEVRAVVEVPDTDGGYLSWERVEHRLDCRAIKTLAREALARRGLAP